jgi:hypothetical protein
MVIFRISNDPRNGYRISEKIVRLEVAEQNFEYPTHARQVEEKKQVLKQCIAWFVATLPVPRSLEIGVDISHGVTESLKQLVLFHLKRVNDELVSPKDDPTTVLLFRLSNTDSRDYLTWNVPLKQTIDQAAAWLNQTLTEWALKYEGPKPRTSLSTGLFNMLKINKDLRRRAIYIVSDGMENNPGVTDVFYDAATKEPRLLDTRKWPELDEKLSAWESFPDLRYAKVRWYFPPHDWKYYRSVQRYWEHVLRDKCHAQQVEVIY